MIRKYSFTEEFQQVRQLQQLSRIMPLGTFLCAQPVGPNSSEALPEQGSGHLQDGHGLRQRRTHTLNEGLEYEEVQVDRGDSWDSGDPASSLLKLPQ